jgi:hypothetical protein
MLTTPSYFNGLTHSCFGPLTVTVPPLIATVTGCNRQRGASAVVAPQPVKRSPAEKYTAIWLVSVIVVAAVTVNVSSIPSPSASV